jgi:arginyl-tRNA synthetase
MVREEIKKLIENSIKALQKEKKLPKFKIPEISVEKPKEKTHGDYSTNIAMIIAKQTKKNPPETAKLIELRIKSQKLRIFEKTEVVKPGFINLFISKEYLQKQVKGILKAGDKFCDLKIGRGRKVNVEFVSANPTGPLTLGNGRGGFCGDVLARVLEKAGYKVTREYYINDIGAQIKKLGHSVLGDEQAVYRGEYINNLRKKLLRERVSQRSVEKIGEKAAEIILKEMIKPSVKKMGIKFDVWFSEKSLYKNKEVDKAIEELSKKGLTYESERATWFKCRNLGDDKDRVLIRANGIKTYFASDIAYLKNKIKRGFKKNILFIGADHYGYVARLKAATEALDFKKEQVDTIVMQLARLFKEGKEVRMSKRAGTYVTLDELIDEVGLDVARFFFLERSPGSHLSLDLDLAKEKSEKNPVYYVQYANARIHSILAKSKVKSQKSKVNYGLLKHPSELELVKQLIRFPEIIEDTASDYQVQRLPQYARELADAFHKFYENCRVMTENKELSRARLSLILAVKIILNNTLGLMGISAPKRM